MKVKLAILCSVTILVAIVYWGCKKNDASAYENPNYISSLIKTYLTSKKNKLSDNKIAKIDSISNLIDYGSFKDDSLFGKKIIIGSLKKNTSNSNTNSSRAVQIIFYIDQGEIYNSNIIEAFSKDNINIDYKEFVNIISLKNNTFTGTIRFQSLISNYPIEYTIKSGSVITFKRPEQKKVTHISTGIPQDPINNCTNPIDWYLNTYDDNTGELISSEYVYTSCEDSGGGDGSGGGGGNHSKMCGGANDYNWVTIGQSFNAQFGFTGFQLVSSNGDLLFFGYGYPCITFSKYNVSTTAQASDAWNNAWNQAVDKLLEDLDAGGPMSEWILKKNMTAYITSYITANFPGSTFNDKGCIGSLPRSNPKWCL